MRARLIALLLLVLAVPAAAQEHDFTWHGHETTLDHVSTGLVAASIGLNTYRHVKDDGWKVGLGREGCETGFAIGTSELAKLLVSRTRPNGVDDKSFWSEHSAIAGANAGFTVQISGRKVQLGWTIAGATAAARVGSGWHYVSDVAVGLADGWLSQTVCNRLFKGV